MLAYQYILDAQVTDDICKCKVVMHKYLYMQQTRNNMHMQRTWKYDPEMYMRRRICNYYALATGRKREKMQTRVLKCTGELNAFNSKL